jgi:hypothetical protein
MVVMLRQPCTVPRQAQLLHSVFRDTPPLREKLNQHSTLVEQALLIFNFTPSHSNGTSTPVHSWFLLTSHTPLHPLSWLFLNT